RFRSGSRRHLVALRATAIVHRAGAVPVQVFGREVAHSVAVEVPAMLTGSSVLAWGPLRSRIPFQPRRTRISLVTLHALQAGRAIGPRRPLVALRAMAIVHRAGAVPVHVFGREVRHSIAVLGPAVVSTPVA